MSIPGLEIDEALEKVIPLAPGEAPRLLVGKARGTSFGAVVVEKIVEIFLAHLR